MDKAPVSPFDEIVDRSIVPALKPRMALRQADGKGLLGQNNKAQNNDGVFAAGVADMDFKAPPAVLAALQHRLEHGIFGYEAVPDELFLALIDWMHKRHNWQIYQTHILRAPNILNVLAIAASLFSEEGDGIIVQPPVFFDFFDILSENNRQLVLNPLILENGRYRMDFVGLEAKASNPRTKMIFLCNPHNPVGRVWTADELKKLGRICLAHNVVVISDEIHGDITFPGHDYTPFASLGPDYADNSITCLSPAKSFNIAACCQAFTIISNDKMRRAFQVENSRLTVNKNNAFASAAMLAAYTQGGPWLNDALIYLQQNINLVENRLQDIPHVELINPEGTFLLWLDFTKLGLEPEQLTAFLQKKAKWIVNRGEAFGTQGKGFARVNIACPRAILETALDNLSNAVSELSPQ